jgi:hypothetical protein
MQAFIGVFGILMNAETADKGRITKMEVAKASRSGSLIHRINKGTRNRPPPAPKKPFANPARAPETANFCFSFKTQNLRFLGLCGSFPQNWNFHTKSLPPLRQARYYIFINPLYKQYFR